MGKIAIQIKANPFKNGPNPRNPFKNEPQSTIVPNFMREVRLKMFFVSKKKKRKH